MNQSIIVTRWSFERKFNVNNVLHPNTIRKLHDKFIGIGSVADGLADNVGLQKFAVTESNVNVIKNLINTKFGKIRPQNCSFVFAEWNWSTQNIEKVYACIQKKKKNQ